MSVIVAVSRGKHFPLSRLLYVLTASLLLTACDTLGYYGQAVSGQLYILTHRQKIDTLLADPATAAPLKAKLEDIRAIRRFAADELRLPLESQYSSYVDVRRPYVVWNVFAAPEFSLQPRSWCYPVAGCVTYRGYFREEAAREFAAELQEQGFDVYVGGVAAYSTLGWFSDPVLNTLIDRPRHQLAALVFHELAHQVAYVPGDTAFNESFATAVEREGQRRWLQVETFAGAERTVMESSIAQELARQEQFVTLVQAAVADLQVLYAQQLTDAGKRAAKARRLQQLREDYALLKGAWQGYDGYDAWFAHDLNNAKLATVTTYNTLVPAFAALLAESDGNLPEFYARAAALARLDAEQRKQQLERLLER
jgi:predicted aminopeptidase